MNKYPINEIRQWPKVELHLHLDLCLSLDAMSALVPEITEAEFRQKYVLPEKISGLTEFLDRSTRLVAILQDENSLRIAVGDLFRQLAEENVIYAEIRFAPLLHTQRNLSSEAVIECIRDASRHESEKYGIGYSLILCTLRHFTAEQSNQSIELAKKYFNKGIAGFDIASEESLPLDPHIAAFDEAHKCNIPCTAHCGESGGPESIYQVLNELNPRRIGHGTRCVENEELVMRLIREQIHLELCPTCNVQLDVVTDFRHHPIDRLYKKGANVGINTDNRTMTGINLSTEYSKIIHYFDWEIEEFYSVNRLSLQSAFISEDEKRILGSKLRDGYFKAGMQIENEKVK